MQDILEETNLLVEKIANYCKPEKIILFGSAARGEKRTDTDIDLLIIKKSQKKDHSESKKYLKLSEV